MTLQEVWSLLNLYNSAFSGDQIDEAIGFILNGGISAAVEAAQQSADAAARSASEAAGSAAESGSAETNAQNAAAQAAESADQAKRYAEQAHAIAGGNLVFSVNGVQADETGNVQIPAEGVKTINGENPDNAGDITLDAGKVGAIAAAEKGAAGGVADLDDEGKVPTAQLPALTPEDIGAFPIIDARTGYDMDAVLKSGVHFGIYRVGENTGGIPSKYGKTGYNYGLIISTGVSNKNAVQVAFISGAKYPFHRQLIEGTMTEWYSFYSEGNIPTPEKIGALKKAGDTMTGNLTIEKATPEVVMRNTSRDRFINIFIGSDDIAYIRNAKDANNRSTLFLLPETSENLANILRLQKVVGGSATYYTVLGTHNKPSGTYTGNGASTARTVDTGGIGNVCVVYSNDKLAIVTPAGAIIKTSSYSGNSLENSAVKFSNGVLTIATTNASLNTSGETYYYQVL